MSFPSVEDFLQRLQSSGLVQEEPLHAALSRLASRADQPRVDAPTLGRELIRVGLLSPQDRDRLLIGTDSANSIEDSLFGGDEPAAPEPSSFSWGELAAKFEREDSSVDARDSEVDALVASTEGSTIVQSGAHDGTGPMDATMVRIEIPSQSDALSEMQPQRDASSSGSGTFIGEISELAGPVGLVVKGDAADPDGDVGLMDELASRAGQRGSPTMMGTLSQIGRAGGDSIFLEMSEDRKAGSAAPHPSSPQARDVEEERKPKFADRIDEDDAIHQDAQERPATIDDTLILLEPARPASPSKPPEDSGVLSELSSHAPWRQTSTMMGSISDIQRQSATPVEVDICDPASRTDITKKPTAPGPVQVTPAAAGDSGVMDELTSHTASWRNPPTMLGRMSDIEREQMRPVDLETGSSSGIGLGTEQPGSNMPTPSPGEITAPTKTTLYVAADAEPLAKFAEEPKLAAGAPASAADSGVLTELGESKKWRNTPTMMGSLSAIRRQSQTDVVIETPDEPAAPDGQQTEGDESHPFGEVLISSDTSSTPAADETPPISLATSVPARSGEASSGDSGIMTELTASQQWRNTPTMMGSLSAIRRQSLSDVQIQTPDEPTAPAANTPPEPEPDDPHPFGEVDLTPSRGAEQTPAASSGDSGIMTELTASQQWRNTPTMMGSLSAIRRQSLSDVQIQTPDEPTAPAANTPPEPEPDDPHPFGEVDLTPGRSAEQTPAASSGDSGIMTELTASQQWRNTPTMMGSLSAILRQSLSDVQIQTPDEPTAPAANTPPEPEPDDPHPFGEVDLTPARGAEQTPAASSGDSGIMTELTASQQWRNTPTMMGSLSAIRRQSLSDVQIQTPDEPTAPAANTPPEPEPDDPHPFGEVDLTPGRGAEQTPAASSGDSGIMTELTASQQWRNTPTMMGSLSAIRRQSYTDVVIETPEEPAAGNASHEPEPDDPHPFGEVFIAAPGFPLPMAATPIEEESDAADEAQDQELALDEATEYLTEEPADEDQDSPQDPPAGLTESEDRFLGNELESQERVAPEDSAPFIAKETARREKSYSAPDSLDSPISLEMEAPESALRETLPIEMLTTLPTKALPTEISTPEYITANSVLADEPTLAIPEPEAVKAPTVRAEPPLRVVSPRSAGRTVPRPAPAVYEPSSYPEESVGWGARLLSVMVTLTMFVVTLSAGAGLMWLLRSLGTQFSEVLLIGGSGLLMLVVLSVAVRPDGNRRLER